MNDRARLLQNAIPRSRGRRGPDIDDRARLPRRGPRLRDRLRRYRGMVDSSARSHAISIFNHLTHAGYDIPPFLVRRWAMTNGWKTRDAQLIDDYAAGVLAGVRYHYQDTAGRHSMKEWQRQAEGKKPWMDPGRLV